MRIFKYKETRLNYEKSMKHSVMIRCKNVVLAFFTKICCWVFIFMFNIGIKENRIYIRVEFRQSLGMNFFRPFSVWKGVSSKCTNHVNVHKLYAVEYINKVCSLDYPFQFRIFLSYIIIWLAIQKFWSLLNYKMG